MASGGTLSGGSAMTGGRTRRGQLRRAAAVSALLSVLVTLAAACTSSRERTGPNQAGNSAAVVVASFNFPESILLGEIYAQALENAGIPVRRELDLGTREMVQPAQRQGLVDVVPEYLGAALASIAPDTRLDWTDPKAVLAALRGDLAPWGLRPLQPSAASDQDGVVVTAATASRLHLSTISELAAVRPVLTLGGPAECPVRPYCLAGLRRVYGLQVKQFLAFDDQGQRIAALEEGVIDVAAGFTTDGWLATGKLVLLRDDRGLQPADQILPVVSTRALTRYPSTLAAVLNRVSGALDTLSLRFLNWRISLAGKDIPAEAKAWLRQHGLLGR
jgi:osmoprotectant transport system substrate-binding protein